MSVARLLVLVAAGVAAVFVWLYVRNSSATVAEAPAAAPVSSAVSVLVAANDIELGAQLERGDMVWREWPEQGMNPDFITDRADPQAIESYAGSIVRDQFSAGEPIVARKLVARGDAGFMAAILEPGRRAVSTQIKAETAAGGFILPGDRVDVIVTYETQSEGSGRRFRTSRTILENVRVLAIDQSPSRSDGDKVKVGSTATLELDPRQSELLALAESMGDVTLALRSISDASPDTAMLDGAGSDARRAFGGLGDTLTVYRYGSRSATPLGSVQ